MYVRERDEREDVRKKKMSERSRIYLTSQLSSTCLYLPSLALISLLLLCPLFRCEHSGVVLYFFFVTGVVLYSETTFFNLMYYLDKAK